MDYFGVVLEVMKQKHQSVLSAGCQRFYRIARDVIGDATLAPKEWQKFIAPNATHVEH
jgi:hypothetical protein